MRQADPPPSERSRFWTSLANLAVLTAGFGLSMLSFRDDPSQVLRFVPLFAGGAIAVTLWPYVLPRFRQRLVERKDQWVNAHVTPRATALWLSDARLVVEPNDRPNTDFALPTEVLSHPRLDYDHGGRVVVIDWERGPIILRTHDAQGLLDALLRVLAGTG